VLLVYYIIDKNARIVSLEAYSLIRGDLMEYSALAFAIIAFTFAAQNQAQIKKLKKEIEELKNK